MYESLGRPDSSHLSNAPVHVDKQGKYSAGHNHEKGSESVLLLIISEFDRWMKPHVVDDCEG